LCPSIIEKYPLSWFVYSLGSLYALASSQSAAAAGEEGINHRGTEAQRKQENGVLSLKNSLPLVFSVSLCLCQ
jgi:hypothetical protein